MEMIESGTIDKSKITYTIKLYKPIDEANVEFNAQYIINRFK